ncbi:MAG TPA: hypothetical protein VGG26_04880 [Terracidiphilus sp.]
MHGVLLLQAKDGKTIAVADQTYTVRGDEVRSELIFHFRDGSIDDEVAEFRQGANFELIRDHHVQKGHSFPHPLDMTVDVPKGQVTWQETKDGKDDIQTQHMDLPPDLVNGMLALAVQDFPSGTDELKTSYMAADPKPRLVQFVIRRTGEDRVRVGGTSRRTIRYNLHIEIGGLAGAIAPIIGKQPSDITLWVLEGDVPMLIRLEGALYPQGPTWNMVLTSPTWPSVARTK